MKFKLFIGLLILTILLINGCIKKSPVCGNNICELQEDCNSCIIDCSCNFNEFCDDTGVCRSEACGDDICSLSEKDSKNCCQDCGCEKGMICNKINQQCQAKAEISEADTKKIIEDYMKQNKIEGKIIGVQDTYHKEKAVKQVSIDCRTPTYPIMCKIILFVDKEGKIIEEVRTV